jgi:PPOX class probable F420-dependent enzyme
MTRIVPTVDAYHHQGRHSLPGRGNLPPVTSGPVTVRRVVSLPESARALIKAGRLAHCATINHDGSPHLSAVWIGLDGDEIVMAHLPEHRKVRNLRRDPRICLSLDSEERNAIGMQYNLVIHGRATVIEGGAPELLQRLVKVYAGPEAEFPLPPDPPPGFVVRIAVERIGGVGPWSQR